MLADALGSALALADAAGTLQTQYTYEPFGKTTLTGALSSNPYQFTGRENDGTGLYYYRARYYHPALQRFISEDPSRFAGEDVNLYAYVSDNPLNFIDSLGLDKSDGLTNLANFAAGFGDTITLGGTAWIRDRLNEAFGSSETVNPGSGYYTAGKLTGYVWDVASGSLAIAAATGWTTKIAIHGAHHTFGALGKLTHIQINWWKTGTQGSGGAIRIPLPWK